MDRTKALVVGILIGALVMVNLPVQAHHRTSYSRLANRIAALESRMSDAESDIGFHTSQINGLSTRMSNAESGIAAHETDINSLQSRMSSEEAWTSTFKSRTTKLTSSGTYTGSVNGNQINKGFCGAGDPAIWDFSGLSC